MRIWAAVFVLSFTCAAGCGGHGPRVVTDPDPESKIPAIKQAARTHDRTAIPQLVKDLDSDDPAVRFYAIDGLQAITGQTLGYRYYDNDDARKSAVARWRGWMDQQRIASTLP